jgi:AcrR family transcriptional regulator
MNQTTRASLLQAAKRLVLERGYASASVRELAAASGTNLGAVNYHFGSREKLLNQAIGEFFMEWAERVGVVDVAPEEGPLEQLAARARAIVEGISEAQPLFVMFLEALLQCRRSPELREQLTEHYAEQRRLAAEFVRATAGGHRLPARTVEVIASYMLAVADGLQLQALLDPETVPTGEELAAFYEGLAARERRPSSTPELSEPHAWAGAPRGARVSTTHNKEDPCLT